MVVTPTANLLTGGTDEMFTGADSSGVAEFIRDGLGSTTALTDSTGAIQQGYTYDPYRLTTTSGAGANASDSQKIVYVNPGASRRSAFMAASAPRAPSVRSTPESPPVPLASPKETARRSGPSGYRLASLSRSQSASASRGCATVSVGGRELHSR